MPRYLPIEEFAFYILGALFMLALYLWLDEVWLKDYEPEDVSTHAKSLGALIDFHYSALAYGLLACIAGWGLRRFVLMPGEAGFPSYFTFLVLLAVLPTVVFIRPVAGVVNWRAFSLTLPVLVLVSLMWEATLGVPYGWWRYREEAMLGIFIDPWGGLPIEAVILWLVSAWGTVVSYEFIRIALYRARRTNGTGRGPP